MTCITARSWIALLVSCTALHACGGETTGSPAAGSGGAGRSGAGGKPTADAGSVGGSSGALAIDGGASGTGGCPGCGSTLFTTGLECCDGACVNLANDILNCGSCGHRCSAAEPYCGTGVCGAPPCEPGCAFGELCCTFHGGCCDVTKCMVPVEGTCPTGCPGCVCAAFDTPVATPGGERPIATLRVGDLVLSVDHGTTRPVRILLTTRTPASHHHMVEVTLASGRVLRMSEAHPTATGRAFVELAPGDAMGDGRIVGLRTVPYEGDATYDILPDSDTGLYFAAGDQAIRADPPPRLQFGGIQSG